VTAATVRLPQPVVIHAPVTSDPGARTLTVRRPESAGGYDKLLWREAHEAFVRAEEAGWPAWHRFVWGGDGRDRQIVHGSPGGNLTVKFHFPVGVGAYAKLVGKPGLSAMVTLDRELRRFLNVQFRHGLPGV
jgi:hypothetical protein